MNEQIKFSFKKAFKFTFYNLLILIAYFFVCIIFSGLFVSDLGSGLGYSLLALMSLPVVFTISSVVLVFLIKNNRLKYFSFLVSPLIIILFFFFNLDYDGRQLKESFFEKVTNSLPAPIVCNMQFSAEKKSRCYFMHSLVDFGKKYSPKILESKFNYCYKTNNIKYCQENYYQEQSYQEIINGNYDEAEEYCKKITDFENFYKKCWFNFYNNKCSELEKECRDNINIDSCSGSAECCIEGAKITKNSFFCEKIGEMIREYTMFDSIGKYLIPNEKIKECNNIILPYLKN